MCFPNRPGRVPCAEVRSSDPRAGQQARNEDEKQRSISRATPASGEGRVGANRLPSRSKPRPRRGHPRTEEAPAEAPHRKVQHDVPGAQTRRPLPLDRLGSHQVPFTSSPFSASRRQLSDDNESTDCSKHSKRRGTHEFTGQEGNPSAGDRHCCLFSTNSPISTTKRALLCRVNWNSSLTGRLF